MQVYRRLIVTLLAPMVCSILFTLASTSVSAQLRVDRMVVVLDNELSNRADFELFNSSDSTVYISNKLFEVLNPHAAAERVELTDPRQSPLLATPRDLVLGPNDRRLVRVFTTSLAGDVDRVFRMTVTPQPDNFEPRGSGVQVVVGYDLLIIQPPMVPEIAFDVARSGDVLEISNFGNTFVYFDRIEYCTATGECETVGARRVYAGGSDRLDLNGAASVRLRYRRGETTETIER